MNASPHFSNRMTSTMTPSRTALPSGVASPPTISTPEGAQSPETPKTPTSAKSALGGTPARKRSVKKVKRDMTGTSSRSTAEKLEKKTEFDKVVEEINDLLFKRLPEGHFKRPLAKIFDIYTQHKQRDDAFLRRHKNKIDQLVTQERQSYEDLTSAWTTELEESLKKKTDSLYQSRPAPVGCEEPDEVQERKDKEHFDSEINLVIINMVGQYQTNMSKKKRDISKALLKQETERLREHDKGAAMLNVELLAVFQEFEMLIEAENSKNRRAPSMRSTANMIENVNPRRTGVKADPAVPRFKLTDLEALDDEDDESEAFGSPPVISKRKRMSSD